MTRFSRIRRRPDHWSSPHERARAHASERLDGPLGLVEATWLEEHLAGCAACAEVAAAYEADRLALRSLRDEVPVPPRDLWARTAAAIERESASRPGGRSTRASQGRRLPVGVMSGLAVIAVVVGVSAVSGGLFNGTGGTAMITLPATPSPIATGGAPAATGTPVIAIAAPTPIAVGAGDVQWLDTNADGSLAFRAAPVRNVCPAEAAADCATLDGSTDRPVAMVAVPKTIIGSPTLGQAVVVSDDGAGGQQLTLMALPTPEPTPEPTVAPTVTPTQTPEPVPTEPTATGSAQAPTPEPTASDAVPSTEPSPSTEPTPSETPAPSVTPEPTIAATLAIASDVTLVGEGAAFSPDGSWFAFTARPVDGSAGPDVYAWHVGDETAHRVTHDGRSYFASWLGGELLVSRPGEPSEDGSVRPETVAIEADTRTERPMGDLWRPTVDATGTRAVAWAGTLVPAIDGLSVVPGAGRLELRDWSAGSGSVATDTTRAVIADSSLIDFDAHWDETGAWFATWIADPLGTGVGRLTLSHVDPDTGAVTHPKGAPTDVQALPGFSLGEGRLAWATPPGQSGEGSRVQVVAWTADGVGSVETSPGGDLIVVR